MAGAPWGGSENLWYEVANHALISGDKVFVSVYDWNTNRERFHQLAQKGCQLFFRERYNPNLGSVGKIGRFLKGRFARLNMDYQSILDFKPDIVLISQGDTFDLAIHHRILYNMLSRKGIPFSLICHSHNQYSFIPPKEIYPASGEIFLRAKQVFFVSQRQWRLTERRIIRKIPNGVITWNPLNLIAPENPLKWPDAQITEMAMVSNLGGNKGHDTLLEILSNGVWKNRDWILNLYGEGEGISYIKDLAEYYGLQDKVRFHGFIKDILDIWRVNQLLLVPSASEGLPISLLEAMSCGRVSVATDVGGISELIIDGETGFLATSPETLQFSTALEKAWRMKDNWVEIGESAFKMVNSKREKNPQVKIYELLLNAGKN